MVRLIGLAAFFLLVLSTLLWLSANAYSKAQTRAVTYRYISDALEIEASKLNMIVWEESLASLDRAFTEADQNALGHAIETALRSIVTSQSTGHSNFFEDVFSGIALNRAMLAADQAKAYGGRFAVLDIIARPTFFHRDGSLFAAELTLLASRFSVLDIGHPAILTKERAIAVLTREVNGWRIAAYELKEMEKIEAPASEWDREDLKGINYFPAGTPWRGFWRSYVREEFETDLRRVKSLGANAIRIFLPLEDFLGSRGDNRHLENLTDLLKTSATLGIRVIPTLFDLKGNFRPETWQEDFEYLERVLPVLAASPAVAFVDLKNEPDLDYYAHGRKLVDAWAHTMIAAARSSEPGIAFTIGWSSAEAAASLSRHLELVTYHGYGDLDQAATRLSTLRTKVGDKAIIVSEIGASSFNLFLGFPGSPNRQSDILARRLKELSSADGVFIWTLNDFESVDSYAVGASPWVRRLQREFGLFSTEGFPKPAAEAVRQAFAER